MMKNIYGDNFKIYAINIFINPGINSRGKIKLSLQDGFLLSRQGLYEYHAHLFISPGNKFPGKDHIVPTGRGFFIPAGIV
jgi:hypothetical protein